MDAVSLILTDELGIEFARDLSLTLGEPDRRGRAEPESAAAAGGASGADTAGKPRRRTATELLLDGGLLDAAKCTLVKAKKSRKGNQTEAREGGSGGGKV